MGLTKEDRFRQNYKLVVEFVGRHRVPPAFDQELYESKVAFALWRVVNDHDPAEGRLSTLFYTYAHNARVDHLRELSRRGFRRCPAALRRGGMPVGHLPVDLLDRRTTVAAAEADEVWDVIRRAAEDDLAVRALRRRHLLRMTYPEIARQEGVEERHLRDRVFRAVERVRKKKDVVYARLGMEGRP